MSTYQWFEEQWKTVKYDIATTCAASTSLDDLKDLSEDKSDVIWDPKTKLTYGSIRGSEKLRANLANLYSSRAPTPVNADNILVTAGAISANLISFYALIARGDHVICHYPTYQQLYDVPASLGAEVSLWRARENDGWQLDIAELESMIRPNTKMIIIKYIGTSLKPLPLH